MSSSTSADDFQSINAQNSIQYLTADIIYLFSLDDFNGTTKEEDELSRASSFEEVKV